MERRKFTREFKLEAVKLVTERGVTMAQAARDLGLHATVLRRWIQDSSADPAQAFPGNGRQSPEAAEITRLKREVTRLKAERDILKRMARPICKGNFSMAGRVCINVSGLRIRSWPTYGPPHLQG